MGRSALILSAAVLWGCPSTGGITVTLQPDGGPVCGFLAPPNDKLQYPTCAAGTECVNNVCVPTCADGGAACPSGTYCEGGSAPAADVCAPVTTATCAKVADCPAPQQCFARISGVSGAGFCASPQRRGDGGYQGCVQHDPNDFCGPDAVCYSLVNSTGTALVNTCLGLPACSQDGSCPAGAAGSVCNDGNLADGGQLIPGKGHLCLLSYCVRETDCNPIGHCFHRTPAQPLGSCDFGQSGDPCFTNADCINSSGCAGADGGYLDGGFPGACQ
jgi:hypothetical protein